MFIRELQLDGYGALHALKLKLEAPVTVIYGPNEAGKSTLLRFVRSMLYGFPTRKDPVERGEPVFGGRHGGRLVLSDTSGREYVLERFAERSNGIVLRDESGLERSMGQAEWERLMLGGISERLFRQLFAVSLNELHELRSLQGEEIGNYLYHTGLAGGSSLTAARRQMGTEMDRLFRPKGTNQEINRLLAAIKETETAIRQSRDGVQYYNETGEALTQVEHQLVSLETSLPELRMQTAKLHGVYELREWWLKREALRLEEEELRQRLPDSSVPLLPEEVDLAWTGLKAKRTEAADKLDRARSTVKELQTQREKLVWDEGLVSSLPEWERLESQREGMVARREEVAELVAERLLLEETIKGTLSRISADWGEEELLSFGGLAAEREQVRILQQTWEQAERVSIGLQADVRRLVRQQEVLQAEASALTRNEQNSQPLLSTQSGQALSFGMFVPRTRSALLQAWHNVEDARRSYDRVRTGIRPSPSRPSRTNSSRMTTQVRRMIYLLAALLVISAVVLPFLVNLKDNGSTQVYALSALMLLLSAALVIIASRRPSRGDAAASTALGTKTNEYAVSLRSYRSQVAERLRQLMNDPETSAAKLIPESTSEWDSADDLHRSDPEDTVWQQLRGAVHEQLERFEEIDRGKSKQQEMESRLQELHLERELVERDLLKQNEQLDELQLKWQQWLHSRKLSANLTPESLPEILGMAEQGQAVLRQRQRVKDRTDTLYKAIHEFEQEAIRLFEGCPPPAGIRADAFQSVQWLYRESMKQQGVKEEAERLERQLSAAQSSAQEAHAELAKIDNSVKALLTEVQVSSEAELEQRLRIDERCLALRKEAREMGLRLESGRDAESQAQLYELLSTYDEASLAALLGEQKALLAAEEKHRTELLDRRGRLAQELERLRAEAELEDKVQRLGELQSKLELLSERYAILALSDLLIVHTKAVFEEERQPEVLQRSSRYLQQMTDGSYIRIVAPGDTKALLAETHDRRLLDSSFLSRGTQEQLYLAMRFALCDAASPEFPLPLLLDDLFVHFDEKRLTHTIPVLEDLAKTRQVLLFTCHRHVAQTLSSGIPAAQVLLLPGGRGVWDLSAVERDHG